MNTPPRLFAAPPPSPGRRRFSLALGAALIAGWAAAVAAVRLLHGPPALIKIALGIVALLWSAHVLSVARHNRRLDRARR